MLQDYNLLPVLVLLLKHRSTVEVARRLGKTQSAVSKSLIKLREAFDDELLVRSGGGLEPTAKGLQLMEPLTAVLDDLNSLYSPVEFNPREYGGEISIAATGELQYFYGAAIVQAIQSQAPQARIKLLSWTSLTEQLLSEDELSIGIHYAKEERSKQLSERRLKHQDLTFIVRENHPFVGATANADFFHYQPITLRIAGLNDYTMAYIDAISKAFPHLPRPTILESQHAAIQLLQRSDSFTISTESIMQPVQGIRTVAPPPELAVSLDLVTVCRTGLRHDAMNHWLHQQIENVISHTYS